MSKQHVCRDCQAPIRWVKPRWRRGGMMPLDIEPVTSDDPELELYAQYGQDVRKPIPGSPLTGWTCHFSTCVKRKEAHEQASA